MSKSKADVASGFKLPDAPKRTAVAIDAADRFVSGGKSKPSTRGKRRDAGERLTIYVPPDIAEAVRVRCAKERRSLSEVGTEALAAWIGEQVNKSTS